jgi:hypothetical protein
MRSKIILIVLVVSAIAITGCVEEDNTTGDLESDTGQNVSSVNLGDSYWFEVKVTEKNQMGLVQARPPIVMEDSLERQNLIQRYKYLNDANNIHHVYLMSHDGKVVSYFVAQGKVSSVNSKLTNDVQIVKDNRCLNTAVDSEAGCFKKVESPQMDGSYGTNGEAIFFFTTEGHYVEWNGLYLASEEPRNIQTAVSLERQTNYDGDASENSTE